MFAGATAAEVTPRQQYLGALVARLVQDEIRIQRALGAVLTRLAFIQIAQLVEQIDAKAGPLDGLQKLLGNDQVGVDISAIQRRDDAFKTFELFHDLGLLRVCGVVSG